MALSKIHQNRPETQGTVRKYCVLGLKLANVKQPRPVARKV